MSTESSPSSMGQIVRIDGDKIRHIRESKGLTQLYVATFVGVTTDTVSRWENKRYPTIKKENGLKLAEALEVAIEDLLDTKEEIPTGAEPEEQAPFLDITTVSHEVSAAPGSLFYRFGFMATAILIFAGLLLFWAWLFYAKQENASITAVRLLPEHVPPGRPFPVIIEVTTAPQNTTASLIVKEQLPEQCSPLQCQPPYSSHNKNLGVVKWIAKKTTDTSIICYSVQCSPGAAIGKELTFSGSVTISKPYDETQEITGKNTIELAQFHWADMNRDNIIDDDEILTVYDKFGAFLDVFSLDRDQLDEIWSSNGYHWNNDLQQYDIIF